MSSSRAGSGLRGDDLRRRRLDARAHARAVARLAGTELLPLAHLTCAAHGRPELVELLDRYLAAGVTTCWLCTATRRCRVGRAAAGGRPALRGRARRACPVGWLAVRRRGGAPRGASGRAVARGGPAASGGEAARGGLRADAVPAPRLGLLRLRRGDAARGADAPVVPGMMPITNVRQLERMAAMSGTDVPLELAEPPARGRRPARRGAPDRRRARHGAVPGAARRGRAGAALLHDEPGRGDARGVREPRLGAGGARRSLAAREQAGLTRAHHGAARLHAPAPDADERSSRLLPERPARPRGARGGRHRAAAQDQGAGGTDRDPAGEEHQLAGAAEADAGAARASRTTKMSARRTPTSTSSRCDAQPAPS